MIDPYTALGLSPSTILSREQILKAHRKAAQSAHPDRPGGSPEKITAVNTARDILLNPERKQRYDQFGSTSTGPLTIEEQCINILSSLFSQVFEAAPEGTSYREMINAVIEEVQKGLTKARLALKLLPRKVARTEKLLSICTCSPLMHDILTRQLTAFDQEIVTINNQIRVGETMLHALSSIKFK